MPCYSPLTAYTPPGGGKVVFKSPYLGATPLTIPCGQCIGCRMSRADEWATRLYHEQTTHDASSFVTLTFSDEHLPDSYSISVRDLQLFIKRLRKRLGHGRVRYFGCGEYGDEGGRPHYHLILYGYDFPDKYLWDKSPAGYPVYRSPMLEELWPFGYSNIGTVTMESLGYVARYVLKKVNGEAAEDHYRRVHPFTGQVVQVQKEFIVMSTRPGIGAAWYQRFKGDAFPSDFVTVNGQRKPIPRYYTKKLKDVSEGKAWVKDGKAVPDHATTIINKRKQRAFRHADNNTPARLEVRKEVQRLRVNRLKRTI